MATPDATALAAVDPSKSLADQSAKGIINATLSQYGLGSLADWAWSQYTGGNSTDQIMLDIQQRPEYKQRFPAMETLAKRGQAITPAQYMQYEQQIQQTTQEAGLPANFADTPDDIAKYLENNISAVEFKSRVDEAKTAIYTAMPEQRQALDSFYSAGGSPGQLTAFFLDPNKAAPLIAKEWGAAQAAGTGVTSGYGTVAQSDAEQVGGLGLSQDQLNTGFKNLELNKQVFNEQVGAHPDSTPPILTAHQQIAAAFLGDAASQQKILDEENARKAVFSEGGTYTQDKSGQGFSGIGAPKT